MKIAMLWEQIEKEIPLPPSTVYAVTPSLCLIPVTEEASALMEWDERIVGFVETLAEGIEVQEDVLREGFSLEEALKAQRLKRQSSSQRSKGRSSYRKKKSVINRKKKRLRKTAAFKRRQVKIKRMKRGRSAGPRRRFVVASAGVVANLKESLVASLHESALDMPTLKERAYALEKLSVRLAEDFETRYQDVAAGILRPDPEFAPYENALGKVSDSLSAGELQLPAEGLDQMGEQDFGVFSLTDGKLQLLATFDDEEAALDHADAVGQTEGTIVVFDKFLGQFSYLVDVEVDSILPDDDELPPENEQNLHTRAEEMRSLSDELKQMTEAVEANPDTLVSAGVVLSRMTRLCLEAVESLHTTNAGETSEQETTSRRHDRL